MRWALGRLALYGEGEETSPIDGYGTLKRRLLPDSRHSRRLGFPGRRFPRKTTRQTGLLFPYFGYSQDKLGADVDIPLYWAISRRAPDATLYSRYMSQAGAAGGRRVSTTSRARAHGACSTETS
ncbi:MAG: hypothetical protein MZV70_34510 [Desulfobacterales bacterium]|nr:hypothetical protein [Desulfobacterales bacterium]